MNCSDFKDLIAERMAGELTPELKADTDAHEKLCPACQHAVADWQQMESLLRSGWPAEDPRRSFFLPIPPRTGWIETVRTWISMASMAAVTACLLLFALLRPAVHVDRSQLSINFAPTHTESGAMSSPVVTEAQVHAWVQDAVAQAAAQRTEKMPEAAAAKTTPAGSEEANHAAQLAVQIQMLKENQASLWQQVQQHGLYLQSSWRSPSDQGDQHSVRP
jgi:hypothetical protein